MSNHPTRNRAPAAQPTVPSRPRADGWTPERQRDFLDALGVEGTVAAACRHVGLSPQSAYALRARGEGAHGNPFAKAWDEAKAAARANRRELVDDAAFTRALHGWVEPVWYRGEQVGERTRHDARLLIKLLELQDRAEERAERRAERAEREAEREAREAERRAQAEQRQREANAIRLAPAKAAHPSTTDGVRAPAAISLRAAQGPSNPPPAYRDDPPDHGTELTVFPPPPGYIPPRAPGETINSIKFQPG